MLREKQMEDAADDYAWKIDPELSRLDAVPPLDISFPLFSLSYAEELRQPAPAGHSFAIDTLEGEHIGNCMYYGLDIARGETEVGILIGEPAYWNQGYGAEAVSMLLNHVFQKFGLSRVYLHTLDWNNRAQQCFRKCGFLPRGRLVRGGHDFMLMELQRHQWEANQLLQACPGKTKRAAAE